MELVLLIAIATCVILTVISLRGSYQNKNKISVLWERLTDIQRTARYNAGDISDIKIEISKLKKQSKKPKKYKINFTEAGKAEEIEADSYRNTPEWVTFYKDGEIVADFKDSDIESVIVK